MTTILAKIIEKKKEEVAALRALPVPETQYVKATSLTEKIQSQQTLGLIAEIKRASPSKGMIDADVDPVSQAITYEQNGATAISVLTDEHFFKGSMDDLRAVRKAVSLPILCKDFIIDEIQIDHAKAAGATIILLIAAALSDTQLQQLYTYASQQDLDVLCEVHNEEELLRVQAIGATLIGINNRDLKTFQVDLQTTQRLAQLIDSTACTIVSESGIASASDAQFVANYGAHAILVGETLMRSPSLQETFSTLQVTKGVML